MKAENMLLLGLTLLLLGLCYIHQELELKYVKAVSAYIDCHQEKRGPADKVGIGVDAFVEEFIECHNLLINRINE